MIFELHCIDSRDRTRFNTVENLLYRLYGLGKLWKKPRIIEQAGTITDEEYGLILRAKKIEADEETVKSSYGLIVEGEYDSLQKFRLDLVKSLKEEKFDYIYILNDEVSHFIASELYPKLNELENLLRKYLVLYSTTKLGPEWWKMMADSDVEKKVNLRVNNEKDFSKKIKIEGKEERLIENQAFLIDFDDLGSMIYKKSAGYLTKDDIVNQVNNLTTLEDLDNFKKDLRTNIKKYFVEFEEIQFQKKWEFLKAIRNKIAHNNLFSDEDFTQGKEVISELVDFLREACTDISDLKINEDEIELIKERIVQTSENYTSITLSQLAEELEKTRRWAEKNDITYIGLKNFATNILGQKGYDISNTYEILNGLSETGEFIKIYDHKDEKTGYLVKAIEILKPLDKLVK
ncbi:HEPN domain-containing protein [Phaeodactylibacter luteus]|uniref:Apea-like HEPN domain-containing protein n=1 Tax=Phaeodactylibacter luteus TaxID=1564516 RepID=A0A5C6RIL9_9BACT|nr:HEPN domain-containing protein [Phaeodactylibacter luteus]TXB62278.1 hypothetical protein FRY97_14610 [Phaeodactylibacter luteus]